MMVTESSKGGYTITVDVPYPVDAVWAIVHHRVGKTWDDAIAYAAQAGPMPLASAEPWEEPDAEYRARLNRALAPLSLKCMDSQLDIHGRFIGLPRARLTPVP